MAKRKAKVVKKAAPQVPPESVLNMSVNGHVLSGEQRNGLWTFACPSWPDLAEKWSGDSIIANIMEEYMRRCLAGAMRIRELASGS